ncbi:Arf-GAP with Rho-GAP domain, ANK repeat and PH domain-containing protein 1, partial [Chelonia mydas]
QDTYSKRFIPVTSIARVASIGDQKFEVITNNRTFAFRAESDADRNEWMRTLQQMVDERKFKGLNRISLFQLATGALDSVDKCGLLELRGFKNKLYVVVAGDKVFLYKNAEDYRQGIGITYIEMNVGNVKDVDRRGFDLTTPYRIFSFSADSDQEKDEWVEAMQQSIAEALSNSEVAEKIWSVEANQFCADCGSPKPDWASVNLCVVICKRCAGEHRGLGPSITKVRSLKMDRKVWTEELIELFCKVGNCVANQFWAANVPPSEAIHTASRSQERRHFLVAKYKEGKYRRYHPLFGNQEELNKALCATVTTSDLAETQSLVFCGAEVSCFSGDPNFPNPIALAEQAGQKLQMEFLLHNKNSEIPRVEAGSSEEKHYSVILPSVTHNGFLFKTPSMAKLVHERKSREEFSRRWCTLNDSIFSYYENDRNAVPNGEIKMEEIVCLVNNPPDAHGFESTFEVYIESERLYLFGLDKVEAIRKWVKSIAKSFVHPRADELLSHDFERIGRLQYKGGLNLERAKEGWFALTQSTLYAIFEDSDKEEALHLKKLQELSIEDEEEKISQYRQLLSILPVVNRATVKALINHLYRYTQCMYLEVPTLSFLLVDKQEMRKQQDEITAIIKMRIAGSSSGPQQAGDFICTVYLEEKKTEAEQHIKIPATMTAEELTFEILDRRKIVMKEKEYWSCFEVNEREEAERPLHYSEKVLPILHDLGTDSFLVVKKQLSMENMLIYLASRVGDSKHGMMKFREERNLLGLGLSTGFHDRYFILNHSCLRLYKEVRTLKQRMPAVENSHRPEKEWPVKNLKVYLGIKKKLRPPSCWGFTVFYENEKHEKQQWYLCCDTQMELREWFATFLHVQNGGNVWPSESSKVRASRTQQDSRLGNISLIPLRGNENEMRNSVAAFAADPLTVRLREGGASLRAQVRTSHVALSLLIQRGLHGNWGALRMCASPLIQSSPSTAKPTAAAKQ